MKTLTEKTRAGNNPKKQGQKISAQKKQQLKL